MSGCQKQRVRMAKTAAIRLDYESIQFQKKNIEKYDCSEFPPRLSMLFSRRNESRSMQYDSMEFIFSFGKRHFSSGHVQD